MNKSVAFTRSQRIAAAIFALGAGLSFTFSNCAKVSFSVDSASILGKLNTGGGVLINNDDEFTKSTQVQLALINGSAEQMYITVDPTCKTGGSWEKYVPEKAYQLSQKNKTATVYVKYREQMTSDLESDCFHDDIVHDDIAPNVQIVKSVDAFIANSNAAISYAVLDSGSGVAGVQCLQDGAKKTCTPDSLSMSGLSEGMHSVKLIATDKAGNESSPVAVAFGVDKTPPTVALVSMPALLTSNSGSSFSFSGTDALSGLAGFECRFDNDAAMVACASPLVRNLAQGKHTFFVKAIDKVGNRSQEAKYAWTIDQTAPALEFTKTPPAKSNSGSAEFAFVGSDDGQPISDFRCSLDGAPFAACSSPKQVTAGEGTHKFSVIGVDTAGNLSEPISFTWIIDLTKPTVLITVKPDPVTSSSDATLGFTATDALTGIASTECSLDGSAFEACNLTKSYANLSESTHKFSVRATDGAGNVSNPVSYSWRVDKTPPTLEILSGPDALTKQAIADFTMKATDANGGGIARLECKLDGEASFSTCTSPKTYPGLGEGNHLFSARAVDEAGLTSAVKTYSWVIDSSGPAINFQKFPLSTIGQTDRAEFAFTVVDSYSDVAQVSCGLDGVSAVCPVTYSKDFGVVAIGDHKFTVIASDQLGNVSKVEIVFKVQQSLIEKNQLVTIEANKKIDVLVVIDNSGSMATEQKNMSSRFSTFIDQLAGLNWQIGIVTTDLSKDAVLKDGRLVEMTGAKGQYIVDSTMPLATAKQVFGASIQRPESGSGNEMGIGASYRAIQRAVDSAKLDVNKPNAALFRSDAALAIVVVTDADETNPAGLQTFNKPEGLVNLVKASWPQKAFSFHSIVVKSGDSVCLKKDGNEGYGVNYETLSKLTGGIIGSVCEQDYGTQLATMGQHSASLINSATLDCLPVDTDGDGKPDLSIALKSGGAVPSYTVSGLKVTFSETLPAGQLQLKYSCLK